MKDKSTIKPGDWFSFKYGFSEVSFCALIVAEEGMLMCPHGWMESSAEFFRWEYLEAKKASYLGSGKKRWWRPLTLLFYAVIHPYSKAVSP